MKWAINRLGLQNVWVAKESPLEITNVETGQKILFRGLDDAFKITSITVEVGYLCWAWLEEAYEILNETDFDTVNESVRGDIPAPLFKQFTITFNPWNERHWLKHRFFDDITGYDADGKPIYQERKKNISDDGEILAMTTNYTCNEFLDEADRKLFETMKKNNPRRYAVAGEGKWGITDGLIYENWHEQSFLLMTKAEYKALEIKPEERVVFFDDIDSGFGLDYGYTNDPSAAFSENEILTLINEDKQSTLKRGAEEGHNYYEGQHDILKYLLFYYNTDGQLVEDKTRSNIKISHQFFTELVDQCVQYLLSGTEPLVASKTPELQAFLDEYFDEDFISELSDTLTDCCSGGFGYMYAYKSVKERLAFAFADAMGVVEVRAKDTDTNTDNVIYWYIDRIAKTNKKIKRRVQCKADIDCAYKARELGCDTVKQWNSTLDGKTRPSHQRVDKEWRELDEPFSNGLMYPGDPSGRAAEVVNCRCSVDDVPRWYVEKGGGQYRRNNITGEIIKCRDYTEFKEKYLQIIQNGVNITAGGISGALNPYSEAASKHAAKYYEEIRKRTSDIDAITKHTEFSKEQITEVKQYLFIEEQVLDDGKRRFDPSYDIAQTWQRLTEGNYEPHDILLIKHELFEKQLISNGKSQSDAHILATKKYNYTKGVAEYNAKIKKYSNRK